MRGGIVLLQRTCPLTRSYVGDSDTVVLLRCLLDTLDCVTNRGCGRDRVQIARGPRGFNPNSNIGFVTDGEYP